MQSSSKKGRGWEIAAGYEKGMRMKRHKIRKKRNPGWYFLLPVFQTAAGSFVGISNYVQVIKNDAFDLAAKNTLRFVSPVFHACCYYR